MVTNEPDAQKAFWDIVAEPIDVVRTLEVGDWAYLETSQNGRTVSKRFVVVAAKGLDDEGNEQLRFRNPTPDDPVPAEVKTTILGRIS